MEVYAPYNPIQLLTAPTDPRPPSLHSLTNKGTSCANGSLDGWGGVLGGWGQIGDAV